MWYARGVLFVLSIAITISVPGAVGAGSEADDQCMADAQPETADPPWTNHPIPVDRAFGITHIPSEEGLYRWVTTLPWGVCRKLNWDFSDAGVQFDCATNHPGDYNHSKGIAADSTYFYVTLTAGIGNGHTMLVERYLHDGTYVDVLIDNSSLVAAGFCCGHFGVSGITVDDAGHLYIAGGAIYQDDNVAVFDASTGTHLATWSDPPFCPFGIAWVESFEREGIVCLHPDGCVIVGQYGTDPGTDCQSGSGPLHVFSPDGSTYYGELPPSGLIRQAGLDIGAIDLDGQAQYRVLWLGHFAHQSVSQLIVEGSFCGDGILDPGEECDDGNNDDGDGCAADCTIEQDVPATTYRGMAVMALLLLIASTAHLLRRRATH